MHRPDVSETTFLSGLQDLLAADVRGLDPAGKAAVLRRAAEALERTGEPVRLRIVPFVPGRRPADEAAHPGLGSSEDVGLILPGGEEDRACILYELEGDAAVRATVSFTGPDGSQAPAAVPGWEDRAVEPAALGERRVFGLTPAHDLLPDGADPFTFGHLFSQRVLVELRALDAGVPVAGAQASLLVCDLRRCGSLYTRLLDRLVTPDTARQAAVAGVPDPGVAYH